jgi:hypothetical protein
MIYAMLAYKIFKNIGLSYNSKKTLLEQLVKGEHQTNEVSSEK